MFKTIINFLGRFTLCTFTIHKKSDDKIQSHKMYDIYACERCGNMFTKKKNKYK